MTNMSLNERHSDAVSMIFKKITTACPFRLWSLLIFVILLLKCIISICMALL